MLIISDFSSHCQCTPEYYHQAQGHMDSLAIWNRIRRTEEFSQVVDDSVKASDKYLVGHFLSFLGSASATHTISPNALTFFKQTSCLSTTPLCFPQSLIEKQISVNILQSWKSDLWRQTKLRDDVRKHNQARQQSGGQGIWIPGLVFVIGFKQLISRNSPALYLLPVFLFSDKGAKYMSYLAKGMAENWKGPFFVPCVKTHSASRNEDP